jgi:hypothetical protein
MMDGRVNMQVLKRGKKTNTKHWSFKNGYPSTNTKHLILNRMRQKATLPPAQQELNLCNPRGPALIPYQPKRDIPIDNNPSLLVNELQHEVSKLHHPVSLLMLVHNVSGDGNCAAYVLMLGLERSENSIMLEHNVTNFRQNLFQWASNHKEEVLHDKEHVIYRLCDMESDGTELAISETFDKHLNCIYKIGKSMGVPEMNGSTLILLVL